MQDLGARPKTQAPRDESTLQTSADSETGAGVDINIVPPFDQSEVDDDDESDVGQTDFDIDDTVLRGTCIYISIYIYIDKRKQVKM